MKKVKISSYKWCRFCGGMIRASARWCMHCAKRTDDSALPSMPGGIPEGYQALNSAYDWLGSEFNALIEQLHPSPMKTQILAKIESNSSAGVLNPKTTPSSAFAHVKPSVGAIDLIKKVLICRTEEGSPWPTSIERWRLEALDISPFSISEELRLRCFELDSEFVCRYCAEYHMEHASFCRFCGSDFSSAPSRTLLDIGHDMEDLRELLLCIASFCQTIGKPTDHVAAALMDIGVSREEIHSLLEVSNFSVRPSARLPLTKWQLKLATVGVERPDTLDFVLSQLSSMVTTYRWLGLKTVSGVIRQYAIDLFETADAGPEKEAAAKIVAELAVERTNGPQVNFDPAAQDVERLEEHGAMFGEIATSLRSILSDIAYGAPKKQVQEKSDSLLESLETLVKGFSSLPAVQPGLSESLPNTQTLLDSMVELPRRIRKISHARELVTKTEWNEALELLEELEKVLGTDDQLSIAHRIEVLTLLTRTLVQLNDQNRANECYEQAKSLTELLPVEPRCKCARDLAAAARSLQKLDEATEYYELALDQLDKAVAEMQGQQMNELLNLLGLAEVSNQFRNSPNVFQESEKELLEEYLDVAEKAGDTVTLERIGERLERLKSNSI